VRQRARNADLSRARFWQYHPIQRHPLLSLLLFAGACALGCSYPAQQPPKAWAQVDQDKPARKPDVPYEPSSAAAIAAMLDLGAAGPSDVVYDLGCGDGRVVIEAVKRSGARGVCVDIDPKLVRQAQVHAARAGVAERIRFRTEDLFVTDIHDASVVLLFLWPEINLRLLPKLLRELRPGTRIVSNMHDMGDFQPLRTIPVGTTRGGHPHHVYLWIVPTRGGGSGG
jgi:SAM-dependent methyltransferase